MVRPDFKSGWGCQSLPGGFDSHSLPPLHFDTAAMITPSAMDKEYLASPGRGGELHPAAQGHRIESQDTTGKVMRHFAEPDHRFLVAFGVGGRSLRIFSIAPSVKAAG